MITRCPYIVSLFVWCILRDPTKHKFDCEFTWESVYTRSLNNRHNVCSVDLGVLGLNEEHHAGFVDGIVGSTFQRTDYSVDGSEVIIMLQAISTSIGLD